MERLTKRHSPSSVTINPHVSGNVYLKLADYEDAEELCIEECGCCLRMVIEKYKEFLEDMVELAEYRQAEEQGLLLRLPYPLGTEIYFCFTYGVFKDHIRKWQCNKDGLSFYSRKRWYRADLIGKYVFLTREEAEAKLAEMQKGEDMEMMDRFIFWCLKRLAVLKIKYTKHPEGKFQMGASVVVKGKRYPFHFESNMW